MMKDSSNQDSFKEQLPDELPDEEEQEKAKGRRREQKRVEEGQNKSVYKKSSDIFLQDNTTFKKQSLNTC